METTLNTTRVSELTVAELMEVMRNVVREVLEEKEQVVKRSPLDIPALDVGPWPEGLQLISREEYYENDDR
jgi:hypothetical protein